MRPTRALILAAALLAGAPALAQSPADGVEIADTVRVRAEVLTVDREGAQILLRNLDTGELFVHAPPRQGAAPGVKSGDIVEAVRTYGVTARPATPEDARKTEEARLAVPARADGDPAMVGGHLRRSVVTITAWDPETGVVTGRLPEGGTETYTVTTPKGRAFVEAMGIGAKIEVEISQAVALRVLR